MRGVVQACLVALAPAPDLGATFRFPADLELFAGHFPGRPLVPAVLLIEATRWVCARARGAELRLARVGSAKFSGEVGPDQEVALALALEGETARATWTHAGDVVARLTLHLEAACTASS